MLNEEVDYQSFFIGIVLGIELSILTKFILGIMYG